MTTLVFLVCLHKWKQEPAALFIFNTQWQKTIAATFFGLLFPIRGKICGHLFLFSVLHEEEKSLRQRFFFISNKIKKRTQRMRAVICSLFIFTIPERKNEQVRINKSKGGGLRWLGPIGSGPKGLMGPLLLWAMGPCDSRSNVCVYVCLYKQKQWA